MPKNPKKASLKKKKASAPGKKVPFWKRLLKMAPLILGVSVLTYLLAGGGWLGHFETTAIDNWLRLKPHRQSDEIVIVGIFDDDYERLFAKRSPLAAPKLEEVIKAIALGKPKVIGVDIDTSEPGFQSLQALPGEPRIVWARDAVVNGQGKIEPQAVLGGREPLLSGIVLLPKDSDGIVRSYIRKFRTTADRQIDSFPLAVVKQYREQSDHSGPAPATKEEEEKLFLNFAGDRYSFQRFHAGDVVTASKGTAWQDQGVLNGKIVLLGGFYRASRDAYTTPLGSMEGTVLMAQAIESELRGGGVRHPPKILAFVLHTLAGFALVFLHKLYRPNVALLLNLIALPVLPVGLSLLVFQTGAHWVSFVMMPVVILLQQLYERAVEHQKQQIIELYDPAQGETSRHE
jgi:CHASE2 domain-containing sensor protein